MHRRWSSRIQRQDAATSRVASDTDVNARIPHRIHQASNHQPERTDCRTIAPQFASAHASARHKQASHRRHEGDLRVTLPTFPASDLLSVRGTTIVGFMEIRSREPTVTTPILAPSYS